MKNIRSVLLTALATGTALLLFPVTAHAQFTKTITVSPGVQTNAVTTWYYSSCSAVIAVGTYTINVAPKHGAISVGGLSAPLPGCPEGSPPLPAAVAYYTWTDSITTATSDSFQLYYNVNGQVAEVDDISVVLGTGGGSGSPGATCAQLLNGGLATPQLSGTSFSGNPIYILGSFTPAGGTTLAQAAQTCGFQKFDWVQTILQIPDPFPFCEVNTDPTKPNPNPFCGNNTNPPYPIHVTSLFAPINDPPPNGWTYGFFNSYPFYYPEATLEQTCAEYAPGIPASTCVVPVVSADGTTLSAFDDPADPCIAGPLGVASVSYGLNPRQCGYNTADDESAILFRTDLAGVKSDGTPYDLGIGYIWSSNFNGLFGGIGVIGSNGSGAVGTGTGGVTVVSVSNTTSYQYPLTSGSTLLLLPGSDVATTASGLAYSRVSQSYAGTVTTKNISTSAITGPFQLVVNSLTASTDVIDPTGNFGGSPYRLFPSTESLAAGQSASTDVHFGNPYNLEIDFSPEIFAGSFN